MTVEQLPGEMRLPTRDEEVARWKRAYRIRHPDAEIGHGTQPDIDANVFADVMMRLYAQVDIAGRNAVLEEARGAALEQWGEREGVGPKRFAVGASGFVTIETAAGGAPVVAGDTLVHEQTQSVYRAINTATHTNGTLVAITGVSTGAGTNLPSGTQLSWSGGRPGRGPNVLVAPQSDGTGLTGGRPDETDGEYLDRILDEKHNRAASGNDAEYQLTAAQTSGVAIQRVFTYPAITGTGNTCVIFTLLPSGPGGSRLPNAAHVGLVEAHTSAAMPADDGALFALWEYEDVALAYKIALAENAYWADVVPWPPYYSPDPTDAPAAIIVSAATSPTSFTLATADALYSGDSTPIAPIAGKTIGFFHAASNTIVRKRLLTVTGTGPWVCVADTTNQASDIGYTPIVGQRAMPWSDILPELIGGVLAYTDKLGPGEQVATFFDEGRRQRRSPRPSKGNWASALTSSELADAVEVSPYVVEVDPLDGPGTAPSVGTPGALSYILKPNDIAFFKV